MLQTNLATRPFYNERAVQAAIAGIGIVVLAFTLFNVVELLRLSSNQSQLGAHAAESEREAARLRTEATRIRTQIDPHELESVSVAAREANGIIDQRAFSWSELFRQFEETLPPNVRIRAVQPRVDKGTLFVAVVVQGRRSEDLATFMDALEATHVFSNVKPLTETIKDGLVETVIETVYTVPERPAAEAAAPRAASPSAALGTAAGTPLGTGSGTGPSPLPRDAARASTRGPR